VQPLSVTERCIKNGSSGDKCECRGKRPSPSKKAHKSRDARTKKRKSLKNQSFSPPQPEPDTKLTHDKTRVEPGNSGLSGSGLLESHGTTLDETLGTLDLYATVSDCSPGQGSPSRPIVLIQEPFCDDLIQTPLKVDGSTLPGALEWNPIPLKWCQGVRRARGGRPLAGGHGVGGHGVRGTWGGHGVGGT
jgi:hypothetical protein